MSTLRRTAHGDSGTMRLRADQVRSVGGNWRICESQLFRMSSRRLLIFTLLSALWPASARLTSGAHLSTRPNVLVIMGDDHAAYALGCYGSRVARTANLDRLASEGARFTRAYCNAPVCTPSRQSLLTGRLPHAVGVTLLSTALAESEITMAEQLRGVGYETVSIGKMHFNSTLKHGFDTRIDHPQHQAHLRDNPPAPLPPDAKTFGAFRPFKDPARVWLNSDALSQPAREADMDAMFFAKEAASFLRQPHERPFFLMVSFYQPHSPFQFPLEYAGLYNPSQMVTPETSPPDASQVPLIFRELTKQEKQGINAAYYTSVAFLDKSVGRVLDALRESGQGNNTLIIYLSDHGYTLGHHGRFEKHCFYEEAVRTPLLVSWPGRIHAGRTIGALTELVDLFPTVAEACRIHPLPDRHGKSLLPILLGQSKGKRHREQVISQYHENEEAMVRTVRWKLIYGSGKRVRQDGYVTDDPAPGRYVRLFDLENDPRELRNLGQDSRFAARVRELQQVLVARFESSCAPDLKAPRESSLEEKLDWYLVPPEVRRSSLKHTDPGRAGSP